jgi:drug/metabolite transporter (DMT)-like permease
MVVLAFVVAFCSAVVAYAGSAMQAFEARKIPRRQSLRLGLLIALVHRPLWLGGTFLNIAAFGMQVTALSLASLAIVQPTLAGGLVVLAAIARWKLNESIDVKTSAGIAAIIAGLIGLAFVAPRKNHLPETAATIGVLGGAFALIVLMLAAMRVRERSGGLPASLVAGLAYAWLSFSGTLIGESFRRHSWRLTGLWCVGTVLAAVLAVTAEMTALQSWPVTRAKPFVFVIQTLLPSFASPFFSAQSFGPIHGIPFALSLVVVTAGAATVASSGALAKTQES